MTFTIATPSESDSSSISTVHLEAMDDNLLTHAQFPSPEGLQFFHGWLAKDTIKHIYHADKGILIARDEDSGEIASFIKWYVHKAKVAGVQGLAPHVEEWPAVARAQYLDPYAALTEEVRDRVVGNINYYHPSYICTNPKFAGRGAASLLLRKVQELASSDNMPIVLEATMNAVPFYLKLGFEIKDRICLFLPARGCEAPTEPYEERCMVWQSQ